MTLLTSHYRYFGAFDEQTRQGFFAKFEEWELETVLQELRHFGAVDNDSYDLTKAPSPLLYRILSNFTIFSSPRIMDALLSTSIKEHYSDWPTNTVPAGVLLALMSDKESFRKWAADEVGRCQKSPLEDEVYRGAHIRVLEAIFSAITDASKKVGSINFPQDSALLWRSVYKLLQFVPTQYLSSSSSLNADMRRLVIKHLHDTGPGEHKPYKISRLLIFGIEIMPIVQCFLTLLKRLRNDIWKGEVSNFPEVVFDSIKDNKSFTDLVYNSAAKKEVSWCLGWFAPMLNTIQDRAVHADTLAKMAAYLLEDLQHERFEDARPNIMCSAMQVSSLKA
jgi:senataxin